MTLKPAIRRLFKSYLRDQRGQFAMWLGVFALPLAGLAMFSLDYHMANKRSVELSSALDSAALAAVTNQLLSEAEREAYATDYFHKNFQISEEIKLTVVDASAERVELTASGVINLSMGNLFGFKGIKVAERSVSVLTRENVICVLTLNPSGPESFSLVQGAKFDSPTCAVQVNSSHPEAAFVDRTSSASAKDFCIRGGAVGKFSPGVNTECSEVADPYIDRQAPPLGPCVNLSYLKSKGQKLEIGGTVELEPGTYCEDLTIFGQDVVFKPGTYILDNVELWINQSAEVYAEDVTFVLHGADSVFYVEKGSTFYLKAPSEGPMAGMAIFQNADDKLRYAKRLPTGRSELSGGAKMTIIGTVYLPTQAIEVSGKSSYGNLAPATSYIGYDVFMGRDALVSIKVDHQAAGLPPILPRSDEGARLVE